MDSIDITDSNYMIQDISPVVGGGDSDENSMFYIVMMVGAVCILGLFIYSAFFKGGEKHVHFSEEMDCPGGFCNRETCSA